MTVRDRAHGALLGLALGDALGMPTQTLSRERVIALWGRVEGFVDAPDENPVSRGQRAGAVTDDTDQALIVGRLLVAGGGRVDGDDLARELVAWHDAREAAGSLDLLGPSTLRAVQAYRAGRRTGTGRWGDTNGAAMRVAPVGVAHPPRPLADLVAAVAKVDALTHDTAIANAGAAAVAAAVSAGVDGASLAEALRLGVEAATLGAGHGHFTGGARVDRRIAWALTFDDPAHVEDDVADLVGTSVATQEAVPAAFALANALGADPWATVVAAANVGGDSDTIAAMAGAIVGAVHGASAFPPDARAALAAANPTLDLAGLAGALLDLRGRA